MIVCAAINIKYVNSNDQVEQLTVCGRRHGDCRKIIDKLDVCHMEHFKEGFIDHKNMFYDRKSAFLEAKVSGQLSQTTLWYKEDHNDDELYSEDLY